MVSVIALLRTFLITVGLFLGAIASSSAAATSTELQEILLTHDYLRRIGNGTLSFHKFYPGEPYQATLILETRLNGVFHHAELPLGMMKEVVFNYSVNLKSDKRLIVRVSVNKPDAPGGVLSFERRFSNPFSLRNTSLALLHINSIEALARIAPRRRGNPIELLFGPVRAGLSEAAKERAFRDYQHENYVLLRLL
jgi:hypothetical protein